MPARGRKTAAGADASTTGGAVTLVPLQDEELEVTIVGLSPLILNKWSKKARRMMPGHPDKPQIADPKAPHNREEESEAGVYRCPDGRPGIPAVSLKAAMVGAVRFFEGLTMVESKVLFHVVQECVDDEGTGLVPIESGEALIREDMVRNANRSADLRYRKAWPDWRCTFRVRYIRGRISPRSLIALVDAAGRGGVGDWRPSAPQSATGTFGQFRVATVEDMLGTPDASEVTLAKAA